MRPNFALRFLHSPLMAAFLAVSLAWLTFPQAATAATVASTTSVSLSCPSLSVATGEEFTVNVAVTPNTPIAGMQFDLSFDPSLVSVTEVQEGNLFSNAGAFTFFNPGSIDNQAGSVSGAFGAIISPSQTVSNRGIFAAITFTANSRTGDCVLRLRNVVVGDANGNSVPVTVTGTAITITDPAPVLTTIGNKVVAEGSLLTFTLSATDEDGDPLTFSASNLPPGAAFDPDSGTFSWTPDFDQCGIYSKVHFQVTDGLASDSEDISITVGNMLRTDVNDDGTTNVLDVIRVGQHWNQTGAPGWTREDINEDGTVNVLDSTLIGQGWTG